MGDNSFEFSSAELQRVQRIRFGVLSPDEIKAMSVCEVGSPVTYINGVPADGGLLDLRMGTMERNFKCKTCAMDLRECPGHFGHIELARPCLHIGFITTIVKVLRCVCFHCSTLLISKEHKNYAHCMRIKNPKKRLQSILKICQGQKRCSGGFDLDEEAIVGDAANAADAHGIKVASDGNPINNMDLLDLGVRRSSSGCGNALPQYRVEDGFKVMITFPEDSDVVEGEQDRKKALSAGRIHEILKRVSDEDCRALGFDPIYARPDWFVVTVLAVPPPPVRPSVMFNSSARSSDDLTYKLADIVKINIALKRHEQQGAAEPILQDYSDLLQYHVCTLMDNEMSGQPQSMQRSGKPIKSIRQRLVGKAGRVRGNLMGKRVDFSARSVITPDPNLGIDQLGVPRTIAMNMTIPEMVTPYNIARMRQLVRNGPAIHPGARNIIRDDGKMIDLRYVKKNSDLHLEVGYKVERHIDNNDPVVFNRQPSLHKMSMMGHRIRVMPWSTFRLNLSCTSPYNADFDGDEMNMHVPQSYMTRAEIQEIILSPRQVVSPQANKPVMGIVQDTLLGCMKFTFRDTFLERDLAFNTLMNLESWDGHLPIPCILKPKPLWSGKQIFSKLLPRVNISQTSNNHPDHEEGVMSSGDTLVRIEQGELLQGIIDKRTVGSSQGSLIHITWVEHGPVVTAKLFTEIQKVVNHWLINNGFSIGIGDGIASHRTLLEIEKTIKNAKKEVSLIIRKARSGKLERTPGRTIVETFEQQVNEVLNKATNSAGKAVKNQLKYSNNVNAMVSAGSKGSSINICQIIACCGQQNVSGKRIPFGFKNRSLPHFNKDDLGPESRGFVENSYLKGLTPQEFYFHAMGGREGLIDTAVKTAETGYIQRRLVKAMEDVMVRYDGTVRNSLGDIIQFIYGEDAMAGEFIEKQKLDHVKCDNDKFRQMFELDLSRPELLDSFLDAESRDRLLKDPSTVIALQRELKQLEEDRIAMRDRVLATGEEGIYLPVNLKRLIWNAQKRFRVDDVTAKTSSLDVNYIIESLNQLCDKLIVVKGQDPISLEAQFNATMLFKIMLRQTFSTKRVLKDHRLNKDAFTWLCGEIEARFHQALSHPGEMVGAIAAQSIGEPATQMTLNTFHYAGVSSKNVTLGVPRLREIINVAATVKTPSLLVHLKPEVSRDAERAKNVLNQLEFTTLANVTEKTEIYYDPTPEMTCVEEDREFMAFYFEIPDDDFSMETASPWMLRFVLDRKKKENKDLTNIEIADRINADWNGDLKAIYSNDNAAKLVLQIRFKSDDNGGEKGEGADEAQDDDIFLKKVEENLLHTMELRGIKGITKVFMREEKISRFNPYNGSYESNEQEWVLDTEGVALQRVMAVEEVDFKRTTSNVVTEMFDVLGIEAARASLLKEVRAVIEFDGAYVNYRHLAMLCDVMTFRGHLMSITRHGINRNDTGPLMRCSFEETVEILVEAAAFSEADYLKGVSENIMVGNMAPLGTGSFDLILNQPMLEKYEVEAPAVQDFATDAMYEALYRNDNGMAPGTPTQEFGSQSLNGSYSPMGDAAFSPYNSPGRSPDANSYGGFSPSASPDYSPQGVASPNYSPTSPAYDSHSGNYSPTSPSGYSPTSPSYAAGFSPTSPSGYSPTSPSYSYSPTSPGYSPTSPGYSPTSPGYSPTSPGYSPTSPGYSPTSPGYSPTSPSYSPGAGQSPSYSPTSPAYSPGSSYSPGSATPSYSPTSPSYNVQSPSYSPTSPSYDAQATNYSPTSPSFSPTSPSFSPSSPSYSPSSPSYSPSSPSYSPQQ